MVYNSVKSLNVQSAATATVLCAATIVTAVAATVRAVATAADENEKDDNPAAVTAEETVVVIVAHKDTSMNFVELCCSHSMVFLPAKNVRQAMPADNSLQLPLFSFLPCAAR